jgi:hypothetical protein
MMAFPFDLDALGQQPMEPLVVLEQQRRLKA